MNTPYFSIVAGMDDFFVKGRMSANGERIQEILNNTGSDFLQVTDVKTQPSGSQGRTDQMPQLTLVKSCIRFIAANPQSHEAPLKRLHNFSQKSSFKSTLIVGAYFITGNVQLTSVSSMNESYALSGHLPEFFALTQATVATTRGGELRVPLLFVNRSQVEAMQLAPISEVRDYDQILNDLENNTPLADADTAQDASYPIDVT